MKISAIVLAAGSGKRMGTAVRKQYLNICGHSVLYYSLCAFQKSRIDEIILVVPEDDIDDIKKNYMTDQFDKITAVVPGGKERYNSVFEGLKAVHSPDYIFIHDGARPFVDNEIIERCIGDVTVHKACVAAVPSKDTIKIVDEIGFSESTPDRRKLWLVQTPQCFEYNLIYTAYSKLHEAESQNELGGINVTDDAMVAQMYEGAKVKMTLGSYDNIKITTESDLYFAEAIINRNKNIG